MVTKSSSNRQVISLIQIVLYICVFTFGVVSVIVGTYSQIIVANNSNKISISYVAAGPSLLVAAGVVQVLVGILGLVGAFTNLFPEYERFGLILLIIITVCLLVVAGLDLTAAIVSYAGFDSLEKAAIISLSNKFEEVFLSRFNSITLATTRVEALQIVQYNLNCCGLWHPYDYNTSSVLSMGNSNPGEYGEGYSLPSSCCEDTPCTLAVAYKVGCIPRVQQLLYQPCNSTSNTISCNAPAVIDVISQLFVTFLLGLLEALASIGFFIGTVLHLIFMITYMKDTDLPISRGRNITNTAAAATTQRGPSYTYYPETEIMAATEVPIIGATSATAHFSAPSTVTS